jgi:carbonic anhydrase
LNVLNFIFDEEESVDMNEPFNYFKYEGSKTMPPCEESVVWFVYSEIRPIGTTVWRMFRDSIEDSAEPNGPNADGN